MSGLAGVKRPSAASALFGLLCCQYCAIANLTMRRAALERHPFAPIARTNL